MSETWVSREELVEVMGDVGAIILCAQYGGRACFVPFKPEGFLLDLLGARRAELLCTAFGGMHIVVPNLRRGNRSRTASCRVWKQGRIQTPSPKPLA